MENSILKMLEAEGCDMVGAMSRFLDDEEMYLAFLPKVLDDDAFTLLGQGLAEQDTKKAFENAHSLKGTIGNMGLTSLYNRVVEIVEPLRRDSMDGLQEKYEELMKEREELKKRIGY